ncbi:hypothetical protein PAECIP111892_05333 [Paenibacillus auburnensis]|uniref:DUF4878 domain-containing protein n=1 Tax=Paenibacillus auburnensis TaxID=2905649 RepID=A0ABM9CTA3_9BACL|nr:hypothetical protein [Paenibacillus auburnensis]CAH1223597.1 hypothetical protein PAECIP111892_05333 [Paenibacillus auburnensis]
MNKLALGIATLLLSTTLLAACGNQESTNANNSGPTTSSNVTDSNSPDSGSTTGKDNNSELSSSDNINWDEVKDPLIDEAMKSKLKASVDAIVIKDVEAFHKTLGPNVGTAHDYLLDNSVEFTDVGEAHEEDGRDLVPVQGENRGNSGNTSNMGYTFYFEKDNASEWQIVSID